MATRKIQRDPTSERVCRNITELRKERKMSLAGLADRLRDVGRPILRSGLHKIENGDRRVDVDDLVAIALALDTSPNRLLLGPVAEDEKIELARGVPATGRQAWSWARGDKPFPPSDPMEQVFEDGRVVQVGTPESGVRWLRFYVESRPDDPLSAGAWARAMAIGGEPGRIWNTYRDALDELAPQQRED
jgi:transcriptional regulator with XRE-family HTH domain